MAHQDYLIEVGTEELPPKALGKLSQAFLANVEAALTKAGLAFEGIERFEAPRRMALRIKDLADKQPDQTLERRGPAVGAPEQALAGFLKSVGATKAQLEVVDTGKGEYYFFNGTQHGKPMAELLPEMIQQALKKLPIPKMMRWGDSAEEFVRPVRWLVSLYGSEVLPMTLFGIEASKQSRGHRFHHPEPVTINSPADYESELQKAHVMASTAQRQALIQQEVESLAASQNATAILPANLLDEISQIVEWPKAILCSFDEAFLKVPSECLVSSLQEHQKCVALVATEDCHALRAHNDGVIPSEAWESQPLLPQFITISNIDSTNPDAVKLGNEKVVHARLSDAAFFFETDLKTPLDQRTEKLKSLTFQNKLGSVFDKTVRIGALAESIANQVGANPSNAKRASALCKSDLVTEMVLEFPELQGLMGQYYAKAMGESDEIAHAICEHYWPKFAGDNLPTTKTGTALSIADKIDTLVGIFGIDQKPTGSKDPFALRRQAIGLIRLITENNLALDLSVLLDQAIAQYGDKLSNANTAQDVNDFILERLKNHLGEQGINPTVFEAVKVSTPSGLSDFDARVQAVLAFRELPEADALMAANKRVRNILAKAAAPDQINESVLAEDAEKALFTALQKAQASASAHLASADYTAYLRELASLKAPLDQFFEDVMVMADDESLKNNRIALLHAIHQAFCRVADVSLLG